MPGHSPHPPAKPIRSTAEFARYVGLSRSTVSRILNGHSGLRPENIRRVEAAIEDTGFTPNAHALHLRGKATGMVGVCMETLLTPTSVKKVCVLQQLLRERGYAEVIEVMTPRVELRAIVQHLLSLRVEAIVFVGFFDPVQLEARLRDLHKAGVPHVIIDNPGIPGGNVVTLDRAKALGQVVNHLLDLGHRHFGLLGISGDFPVIKDRLNGIRLALAARGMDPDACTVSLDNRFASSDHFEHGTRLARGFMELPKRPTAYIAVDDETAVGALLEFQARGLKIPRDCSIVGFNNQPICLMTRPLMATIDQQVENLAHAAADVVERLLSSGRKSEQVTRIIDHLFIPRESTGPAPRG